MASLRKMLGIRRKEKAGAAPGMDNAVERLLLLSGRMASGNQPVGKSIRDLADVEFCVFSQWGEDGIIEWLVKHVATPTTFVEFGVDSFHEANCRFLLLNRNWRGLVMDGSERNMTALRSDPLHWRYDVTARAAFITRDNINSLLREAGFEGPLGILSIDIDGNDYWVWQAINGVQPAIVVCEYNPILGDQQPVVVPYDPAFARFKGHYSGLYFGASIAALRHLAQQLGYEFVGTNSNGINAFFVRRDLAESVLSLIQEVRAYPSRHRDSRDRQGRLDFTRGRKRFDLISHMPVVDVATNRQILLGDIVRPYSDDWLAQIS